MKNYNKIIPIAIAVLLSTSCDESKMEWETPDPSTQITTAEIPLKLAEKISRYQALKTYTDMKLGIGIGLSEYIKDTVYANIVNQNFDEITIGYNMKHGPMVNSNGVIEFKTVDDLITKLKAAGLGVYGHTLVWHQNQDASYLNGLIAPTVIAGPAGSNLLNNGDLDGNITGWGSWGGGKESVEYTTDEKVSGTGSIKAVTKSTASKLWDLEIESSAVPVVENHKYQITFFIKSSDKGHVRLAFKNMNQDYPQINGKESVETSSTWQQVTYDITTLGKDLLPKAGATTMQFRFDVGADPSVTYYIDNIVMVDLDAAPTVVNLVKNSTFESGSLDGWGGWGNSSTRAVSAAGEGYGEKDYAMVLTNPTAAKNYNAQQVYTFSEALIKDKEYTCSFWVKATTSAVLQVQIQNAAYSGDYYGGINIGTTWAKVEKTIKPTTADKTKFVFDFGETACTYYIDNVVISAKAATAAPKYKAASGVTIIEKTVEEKAQIIGAAMESWITQMVTHYKGDVHAWDVVNEPLKDDATMRDGNVAEPASDEFYWVKYLGEDYAVTAFKLARQYGNTDDVLFINDYNLEHNIAKCKALIAYVGRIESKGAVVDGIGTQMHISIKSNKEKITEMFTLLAATGKKIKISELDIKVETDAPSTEQYTKQAEMYQFVVDQYRTIIPVAQQYGITIWGVSDNEKEHVNWIPNDAPNLWNANYERKHAYKTVADGLAGKDVSADFTGELSY